MSGTLHYRGLIVGINDYRAGITPLRSAVGDAHAVAELLRRDHGYEVTCLVDAEARVDAILAWLESAAETLDEEHGLLLFFAGHGIAMGSGDDGPQGYLLTHDAMATDDGSWLSMNALRSALDRLPCRHVLVILDCCFAGTFRWSSSRDAVFQNHPLYDSQLARYLEGNAWQALTSASHDQRAADTLPGRRNTRDDESAIGHSPFAEALLRGLGGHADSARGGHAQDGVITATELYQFLFEELQPSGSRGARQTPGLWPLRADGTGEYVFRNPQVPLKTLPDPPLDALHNPWVGLRAYAQSDASLFFGRQRVVQALLARARDPASSRLLLVVGASGTGKSSVVRAGLIPALVAEGWSATEAPRLRAHPREQLAQAIAALPAPGAGPRLLLFDQFEELYTQCADNLQRDAFLAELRQWVLRPDGPLLVLTLRSDFEPRLAACSHFGDLLDAARYRVPTFSSEEMREVVEAPLRARALFFDPPELLDRLLDEVAAMPGALPLLSFALSELYRCAEIRRRRTGASDRALTADDCAAIGGVIGALHLRASTLYLQSTPELQAWIERVLLRMVSQEGARIARRRVSRAELEFAAPGARAQVDLALASYIEARLLIVDGDYVEPAHDSLVTAWEQLQTWLADSSATHWLVRALWRAARDWDNAARSPGLLWNNDPRLAQALAMPAELNRLETEFVHASERLRKRRRRTLTVASLAIMAMLGFAALYSMERANEALRQTALAEAQLAEARHANGRALLAQAQQSLERGDYFQAALTAGEALGYRHYGIEPDLADAPGAMAPPQFLQATHAEYPQAVLSLSRARLGTLLPVAWADLAYARVGHNNSLLAGFPEPDQLEVLDFDRKSTWRLPMAQGRPLGLEIAPGQARMAAPLAPDGGRARVALWRRGEHWGDARLETLALPAQARVDEAIRSLKFSPEGDALAAVLRNGIAFWHLSEDASSAAHWLPMPTTPGVDSFSSVDFSPDGRWLVTGGWHHRLTRYPRPSPGDPELLAGLRGQGFGPNWSLWSENTQKGDFVNAIAHTRDGSRMVIASAHQILSTAVGDQRPDFDSGSTYTGVVEIQQLAIAEGGDRLVFHDADRVRFLSLPDLRPLAVFEPPVMRTQGITHLQWFDEDRLLMLSDASGMLLVDVSGLGGGNFELPLDSLPSEPEPVASAAQLRALIADGRLDPLRLAHPDPSQRDDALQWEIHDDEDGLEIWFSSPDPDAPEDQRERGTLQLSLQPGPGSLVSVGITRFSIRSLRGSDRAVIEMVDLSDHALVFAHVLDDNLWGLDTLRFSEDGSRLLARVSSFDGDISAEFAFPVARPDLSVYLDPKPCQPPINLPAEHWLRQSSLMDCPPES